ncbi:hypothetical protein EJB05_54299, partial [Eragrostis curvula]
MEGLVPRIAVLALGAGALGGADALRLLLSFAGRNPLLDIAICLLVMAMLTAHLLGAVTLARFVRKARPGAGDAPRAPAANIFDRVTLMMSVCVAFLVTACLVVVPLVASGGVASVRLLAVALGVGGAAFTCTRPLQRVFRNSGNAGATVPVARATGRLGTATPMAVLGVAAAVLCTRPLLRRFRDAGNAGAAVMVACATAIRKVCHLTGLSLVAAGLVFVISFTAHGGHDAPRFFTGCNNTFVGAATVTVVGVALLVCFPRSRGASRAMPPAPEAPFETALPPLRLPRSPAASAGGRR